MKRMILFFSFLAALFIGTGVIFAQEKESVAAVPTPTVAFTKVEYALPYAGILPDHPLYNLKRFRDYVLEKLISDPIKKTEFYVLQADKRLQMGIGLTVKQNTVLAESTISKGEKYLSSAISILMGYKASGNSIPPYVVERVTNALGKHEEVLTTLLAGASDQTKAGLSESLALVKKLQADVATLK